MAFTAWVPKPIELEIAGKTYEIPQLSAKAALDLAAQKSSDEEPDAASPDEAALLDTYRAMLGDEIFEQMIADGVPRPIIQRAGLTVWADDAYGREVAESYWAGAIDPSTKSDDVLVDEVGTAEVIDESVAEVSV
jgi:hypothetical protein